MLVFIGVSKINKDGTKSPGGLALFEHERDFYMRFHEPKSTQFQNADFIFEVSSSFDPKSSGNDSSKCSNLERMEMNGNPLGIALISKNNDSYKQTFEIPEDQIFSLIDMIETLITRGVAVISTGYSLMFYELDSSESYLDFPLDISYEINSFSTIDVFWKEVLEFYSIFIKTVYVSGFLTNKSYPLGEGIREINHRVLDKFKKYKESIPKYEPISSKEWKKLFDKKGRIVNYKDFMNRIYHAGVDPSIRKEALPYIFKLYEENSTKSERKKLLKSLKIEFKKSKKLMESYFPKETKNKAKLNNNLRVIDNDVHRTDRTHPFFKKQGGIGSQILTLLLRTYIFENYRVGYLQGMNDLFVPIILTFFPKCDDEGVPIDSDGNPIDYQVELYKIFWCFDAMIKNVSHTSLLTNINEKAKMLIADVFQILSKVSPYIEMWMKVNSIKDNHWLYSDFILLFKRSFTDIWPIWYRLNCFPEPSVSISYFVAAIFLSEFDKFSETPHPQISVPMTVWPQIVQQSDPKEIGEIALWLYHEVPPNIQPEIQEDIEANFTFFEPSWKK